MIRAHGLKTCLYSGASTPSAFCPLFPLLDYLKIGAYDEQRGGLDSPTTNQRFYQVKNGLLEDKTYLFRRKNE